MPKNCHKLAAVTALGPLHPSLPINFVQTNIVNFITKQKPNWSPNSLFRLAVDVFAVLLLLFFVFPMLTNVEIL